jgi:hypothetical protein
MNIPPKLKHPDANRAEVSREITGASDNTPAPSHSPLLMNTFLKALDPSAERFTLQCFRDPKHRKNEKKPDGLRLVHHCTPDEAVALVSEWNTPEHGYGFYITVNETDLGGRARENIIRARAVYVDVDETPTEVVARLQNLLAPSAIIKSSTGHLQIYWWVDETFQLDQFEPVQRALIAKLGTDPQVHDLPRVMRLPGSLHLKGEPQLVKMKLGNNRRHSVDAIIEGLGLAPMMNARMVQANSATLLAFPPRPPLLGPSELSAGIVLLAFDFEKALSAGEALAAAGKLAHLIRQRSAERLASVV